MLPAKHTIQVSDKVYQLHPRHIEPNIYDLHQEWPMGQWMATVEYKDGVARLLTVGTVDYSHTPTQITGLDTLVAVVDVILRVGGGQKRCGQCLLRDDERGVCLKRYDQNIDWISTHLPVGADDVGCHRYIERPTTVAPVPGRHLVGV
jgi:hypothetical protein